MTRSPFPGMDPFLETCWPEVHASLIVYARNQLNAQLPEDLQANIEENLAVRYEDQSNRGIRPDLNVSESWMTEPSTQGSPIATIAEPLLIPRVPAPERHIEIVSGSGQVITAIEFISPLIKLGYRGREKYFRKQQEYIAAGINLVEIDLTLQGEHVLAVPLEDNPEQERSAYMACVYRDICDDQFEVYRASLRGPLPNIPVPLRRGGPDAVLQLQPLIDACYHDGRYHRLDYNKPLKLPCRPEDANWIEQHLKLHKP
jgi:hypothetical protein